MENRVKVLAIVGVGRSGSTILSKSLGAIEGFVNIGEPVMVWEHGLKANQKCGCNSKFNSCEFWNAVLKKTWGELDDITKTDISHLYHLFEAQDIPSYRQLLRGYTLENQFNSSETLKASNYMANLEKFYNSLYTVGGNQILIDSSKLPTYLHLLSLLPSIDLFLLHLVRDPRAVSFSWQRKKARQKSILKSSREWLSWNLFFDYFGYKLSENYIRIYYENFIEKPRVTIRNILRFLEEPEVNADFPFIDDNTVRLYKDHNIGGNTSRKSVGSTVITPDNEWRYNLSFVNKYFVSCITMPLLFRYGYPILNI